MEYIYEGKDILILTPAENTPGKKDYTGAFRPEAERFAKSHGTPWDNIFPVLKSTTQTDRVLSLIERTSPKVVAFFCHGYTHGIQLGFRSPKHPRATKTTKALFECLADTIAKSSATDAPLVILYACSTGDDPDDDPDTAPGAGDDSFADLLRDGLCSRGATNCRVVAHTTAGHCTMNPNVKLFDGMGSVLGGTGGIPVVKPGTKPFREFRRRLSGKDASTPMFRFEFPFWSVEYIHRVLKYDA